MTNQIFYGDSTVHPGYATHMSAVAVDPEAFSVALSSVAEGGAVLHMFFGNEWTNFPIESLAVPVDGGSTVPGLVINPPHDKAAFGKEIPDWGEHAAEVVKDDVILATITGVIYPNYISED